MVVNQIKLILFILLVGISSLSASMPTVDPQHESHFKVFVGLRFDQFLLGVDIHIPITKILYYDQSLSLIPKQAFNHRWDQALLFNTTIQFDRVGFTKFWITDDHIKYTNQLFVETLE